MFKNLFTPIRIGPVSVPNRIVLSPLTTCFARDNVIDDRFIEYFRRRAEGGAGLLITGVHVVHPTSQAFHEIPFGFLDAMVPQYEKLASAVHEHGAKVFAQIGHLGRQMSSVISRLPLWAPSPIACPIVREVPKQMNVEEIQEVIEGFAKSAENARRGGLDGVELHCANGYLLEEFLSPATNHRRDEYGGSLENRMRTLVRVIESVRNALGPGMALGMRFSADEFLPDGLTIEESKTIIGKLMHSCPLDYINVTCGTYAAWPLMAPPMATPLAQLVPYAAAIKEDLEIPVITNGRINDPELAERIIADGQADLVAMGRPLVCDPDLPIKAREGRLDEIRNCIACNQGCIQRMAANHATSCTLNPEVGKEREFAVKPAKVRKRVMVIGGGPAGLEAAWIAGRRGHEVTLFEKLGELGGQINFLAKVPSREEFAEGTRFLARQLPKVGVRVLLGTEATPELVRQEGPDVVVVATGSSPSIPPIPGAETGNVVTARQVLAGDVQVGQRVLLVDGGEGHMTFCGTAEFLLEQGKYVEMITPLFMVGMDVNTHTLVTVYERILSRGAVLTPHFVLKEISGCNVIVTNVYSRDDRVIEGIDTVVIATQNLPNNELVRALEGQVAEIHAIGDCVAPRKAIEAIYEGFNVARLL